MGASIRDQNMDEILNQVQMVASVGTAGQMRSLMAVLAKSALEVGDSLGRATTEIRAFNDSTTQLTQQVIALNRRVVWANVVIAAATAVAAVATVIRVF